MAYITLDEAKAHLRVDWDDDDAYISSLIDLVEAVVANEIEDDLVNLEDVSGIIPAPLIHAMLLILGHFFAVRESVIVGVNAVEVPFGFKFLIAPYKNWVIGQPEEEE